MPMIDSLKRQSVEEFPSMSGLFYEEERVLPRREILEA